MSKRTCGLVLFLKGGLCICLANWLAMWWIAPIWRNTPPPEFEGTIWFFGGPIFMIIALSVAVGIALAAVEMALYSELGTPGRPAFVLHAAGLVALAASVLVARWRGRYFCVPSGIGSKQYMGLPYRRR